MANDELLLGRTADTEGAPLGPGAFPPAERNVRGGPPASTHRAAQPSTPPCPHHTNTLLWCGHAHTSLVECVKKWSRKELVFEWWKTSYFGDTKSVTFLCLFGLKYFVLIPLLIFKIQIKISYVSENF